MPPARPLPALRRCVPTRGARLVAALACLLAACAPVRAETRYEFWPELDVYLKLDDRARVFLLSGGTRVDNGSGSLLTTAPPLDGVVGVHLDYALAPPFRPQLQEQDWARNRYLWARIGYQYSRSLQGEDPANTWRENRLILESTGRTPPLAGGLEWVFRARWDLRDRNDVNSSLYRLRLGVERQLVVMGRATVPYADAETIYDTRYDVWKQQRYRLGVEVAMSSRWRIEPAFTLQLDDIASPRRLLAFGLALKYYH